MQLKTSALLTVNLTASTAIFMIAAHVYIVPRMAGMDTATLFAPILLLHAFRHLGLMFLSEGAVRAGMPRAFALPAAVGDLLAAALALVALGLVLHASPGAVPVMWIFNVVGTLDLLMAIALATRHGAAAFMGAAYWIPAFWVPTLLVTHYLVFIELLR